MKTLLMTMKYLSVFVLLIGTLMACGGSTSDSSDKDSLNADTAKAVADSNAKEKAAAPPCTEQEEAAQSDETINTLTAEEAAEGWKLLFDGQSVDKWRGAHKENFPEKGWIVQDGLLIILASGGGEATNAGDIVTKAEYSDFHLKLDFMFTEGANSGIKYYVTEQYLADSPGKASAIGLEFQILDDALHPDAKKGSHEGSRTVASLYDLIKAEGKQVNPPCSWNTAEVIAKGKHVEHWINGKKVVEYDRDSEAFAQLIAESKYKDWDGFGLWEKGHILLQDHGDRVYYRNIKIKNLAE